MGSTTTGRPLASPADPSIGNGHPAGDDPDSDRVLVVLDPEARACPEWLGRDGWHRRGRLRFEAASPASLAALRRRIAELAPGALLIDADWLARVDAEDIAQLRRELADLRWVLMVGQGASVRADLMVRCHACGCLEWNLDPAAVCRAMEAVLRGEHWFARAVMQRLYLSLLANGGTNGADLSSFASALSPREFQSLTLMRQGLTNKQIAARMGVSVNTVKKHLSHAFEKTGLQRRRQLQG